MKNLLIHGIVAGVLASIASILFLNIYQTAFYVDFSAVINSGAIIGACMIGCLLMTLGYVALIKLKKENLRGWLNIIISVLSFASIIPAMGMSLPLDVEFPELFPGLVMPMHFFPALAFFTVLPLFEKNR